MKKLIIDKRLKMIGALVLVVLALLIIRLLTAGIKTPLVTASSPKEGETQVSVGSKISIIFDDKITSQDWLVTPSPGFDFSFKVDENKLEIQPKEPLKFETRYLLEIKNKKFKDFSFSLSFSTLPEPIIYSFPTAKGDPDFYEKSEDYLKKNYPLFKVTPYQTENWSIDYLGPLKFEVILKKDTSQIRQEVLDWIASKGVDPSTHKIIWKIQK